MANIMSDTYRILVDAPSNQETEEVLNKHMAKLFDATITIEQLRAENAELRGRCEGQDRQIAILEAKNKGTLANSLCPDCRDKQVGKPCLGCTIQTLEKRVVVATEALEYYEEYYQGNGIDIPDDSLRARMALAALKGPKP